MRVIVNADDFGLMDCVSRAIADSFDRKLITQTTLMVNMPNCEASVEMARARGFADRIGLHLNLTYGMPLTDDIKKSKLFCNADGCFSAVFHNSKKCRFVLPRFERNAVKQEIEAQMRKYVSFGLPLMHLDSHHHSHTDYSIARIALPIAREMGFKSVRLSRNAARFSWSKRFYKGALNRFLVQGFNHTHYFGGVDDFVDNRSFMPDDATVEIMVHPVYRDKSVTSEYVPGPDFMDFNSDPKVWEGVMCNADKGLRFVTYAELKHEGGAR